MKKMELLKWSVKMIGKQSDKIVKKQRKRIMKEKIDSWKDVDRNVGLYGSQK